MRQKLADAWKQQTLALKRKNKNDKPRHAPSHNRLPLVRSVAKATLIECWRSTCTTKQKSERACVGTGAHTAKATLVRVFVVPRTRNDSDLEGRMAAASNSTAVTRLHRKSSSWSASRRHACVCIQVLLRMSARAMHTLASPCTRHQGFDTAASSTNGARHDQDETPTAPSTRPVSLPPRCVRRGRRLRRLGRHPRAGDLSEGRCSKPRYQCEGQGQVNGHARVRVCLAWRK